MDAVIVTSIRTPVGKAFKGALANTRPDELGGVAIKAALERTPNLDPALIDDVVLGCAFPEAEQGMNMGRISALLAGLSVDVAGVTVNRFCASGLQALAFASNAIGAGQAEALVACGSESMTRVPGGGNIFKPSTDLLATFPGSYYNMGITAEKVADRFGVSREDQDAFAAKSHEKALLALKNKVFAEETVPVNVTRRTVGKDGTIAVKNFVHEIDEGPREGTTPEGLSKLKPAFKIGGSVTAGNSSQMSDGAAASILVEAKTANRLNLKPLGRLVSFAVGGVAPEIMGIGPVAAIPKALKIAGLRLDDIGLIELNEAFASQALYVMSHLEIDPARVNVNGGAIALGHPLGCSGTKLAATLLHEMRRRKVRYGMVSMCIAGGQGAAGIFENLTL